MGNHLYISWHFYLFWSPTRDVFQGIPSLKPLYTLSNLGSLIWTTNTARVELSNLMKPPKQEKRLNICTQQNQNVYLGSEGGISLSCISRTDQPLRCVFLVSVLFSLSIPPSPNVSWLFGYISKCATKHKAVNFLFAYININEDLAHGLI